MLLACNTDDTDTLSASEIMANRSLMLQNASELGVQVSIDNFRIAIMNLKISTESLVQETNETNLLSAREQWKKSTNQFKKLEFYNFLKIADEKTIQFIHFWPLDEQRFQEILVSEDEINATLLNQQPGNVKGLTAIEYILFQENAINILKENNRIRNYLVSSVNLIVTDINETQKFWTSSIERFNDTSLSDVTVGQNQLANTLIKNLQITRKARLALALNLNFNAEDSPDPTKLEAWLSNSSISLLKSNFAEWKATFYNDYPNTNEKYGFNDLLNDENQEDLLADIESKISQCDK